TMIKYYDICSMYPAIMALRKYPVGHPQVITSDFRDVENNKLPYRGVVKLRILPPQDLELAVLPLRHDGALYFALCAACVRERCEE
ncbi:hypothetical protein PENTCL1PPCAC_22277, partial [Pristionchus entomophagus]